MSIVAVHSYPMYTAGAVKAGPVVGVVSPANGLIWDFNVDPTSMRSDQDFSWAFPPNGTPTPQTVQNPTPVTYATGGSKTATLTVTNTSRTVSNKALTNNVATLTTTVAHGFNVGQTVTVSGVDATFNGVYVITAVTSTTFSYTLVAANVTSTASGGTVTSAGGTPAAGSYPVTITAAAGVAPLMAEGDGGPQAMSVSAEEAPSEEAEEVEEAEEAEEAEFYDPNDHTVSEVLLWAEAHPEQALDIYNAEVEGKNRSSLVSQLEGLIPYDPADYNVPDVIEYAEAHPDEVPDIIAKEEAGRDRTTLLTHLRAL